MSRTAYSTSESRAIAATGSITLHTLLIIFTFLMIKGCGNEGHGDQYMALNIAALGDFEQGSGDPTETPVSNSQPAPQAPVEETEEQIETEEESQVTTSKPVEKPKTNPVKPVQPAKETPKETPQKPSDALHNAINQLNKPGTSSGQTTTGGNEGNPNGQIGGKGVFSGGGGSGEWSLSGRNIRSAPSLNEKPTDEGKVVVDVWVNSDGTVVKAEANPAKSTTTNSSLYALAEKAAKSAKFDTSPNAGQQKGTITIIFKLK